MARAQSTEGESERAQWAILCARGRGQRRGRSSLSHREVGVGGHGIERKGGEESEMETIWKGAAVTGE